MKMLIFVVLSLATLGSASLYQNCHNDRVQFCSDAVQPPYTEESVFTSQCFIDHVEDISEACRLEMLAYARTIPVESCKTKAQLASQPCKLRSLIDEIDEPEDVPEDSSNEDNHHHRHHHHNSDEDSDADNHHHRNHHHHDSDEDSNADNHRHHNHHHHDDEDSSNADNRHHHRHHHHLEGEESSDADNHHHHNHHHHEDSDDDSRHHHRHHHHDDAMESDKDNHNHHRHHHHDSEDEKSFNHHHHNHHHHVLSEKLGYAYQAHPSLFLLALVGLLCIPSLLLLCCCCRRPRPVLLNDVELVAADDKTGSVIPLGNLTFGPTTNSQYVPVQVVYGHNE